MTDNNTNQTESETTDTGNTQVDTFLDDVFGGSDGTPEDTGSDGESETNPGGGNEENEPGAGDDKFQIEIDGENDDVQVGNLVKRDGQVLANQEITLEDGSKVNTDAQGKITEITPVSEDEDDKNPNIFKIKTTDDNEAEPKVERFDISKPEDRAKVVQYMQQGRYLERSKGELNKERETFESEKSQGKTAMDTLAWNTMYLVSAGKLNSDAFTERPYEDFIGKSAKLDKDGNEIEAATEAGDRKLWNDHNNGVRNNQTQLAAYKEDYRKTASQFLKISQEFVKAHPEIKDVKKWVQDNIGPYHQPVMSYGKLPYPEDILEMVFFWKNRESIMNKIREEERRKVAKAPVKKDTNNNNRAQQTTKTAKVDNFINNGIFKTTRKIVH